MSAGRLVAMPSKWPQRPAQNRRHHRPARPLCSTVQRSAV
jgi:hypothetical protein